MISTAAKDLGGNLLKRDFEPSTLWWYFTRVFSHLPSNLLVDTSSELDSITHFATLSDLYLPRSRFTQSMFGLTLLRVGYIGTCNDYGC
jgi:hypothetical protein